MSEIFASSQHLAQSSAPGADWRSVEHRWGGRRLVAVVIVAVTALSLVAAVGVLVRDERADPVAAGDSAEAWVSEIEYPDDATCTSSGVPERTTVWDPGHEQVWIDFESDGAADVVRIGEDAYLRASAFPGFAVERPWIHVPVDIEDPVFQELMTSTLFLHAREALVEDVVPPTRSIPEEIALLEEQDDASSPISMTTVVDSDGEVVGMTVVDDSTSLAHEGLQRATTQRLEALPEIDAREPAASDVLEAGELSAAEVLNDGYYSVGCSPATDEASVEERHRCVVDATEGRTLDEWIAEQAVPEGALTAPPCVMG